MALLNEFSSGYYTYLDPVAIWLPGVPTILASVYYLLPQDMLLSSLSYSNCATIFPQSQQLFMLPWIQPCIHGFCFYEALYPWFLFLWSFVSMVFVSTKRCVHGFYSMKLCMKLAIAPNNHIATKILTASGGALAGQAWDTRSHTSEE